MVIIVFGIQLLLMIRKYFKKTFDQHRRAVYFSAGHAKKAVTYDGFHPRHATMLTDHGLQSLCILWQAVEISSVLPPQIDMVMAPLLPKKGPGYRDIAFFLVSRGCVPKLVCP